MTGVLVLGIGNILWGDEGFGIRAVEAFHAAYEVPPGVEVMDGGTQGLYLVQHVEEADDLLVFDAIDYGLPAGTLHVVHNDEVPKFTGAKKMSLHQTGFQEVLSAADLLGRLPRRLALVGCQALDLEAWGGALTDPVRAAIGPALAAAVAFSRTGACSWRRAGRRCPGCWATTSIFAPMSAGGLADMCIGIPMTVVESDGQVALCERRGEVRRVSLLLLGEVPVGTQVLVHMDSAVRVLDAEEARQIADALDGVAAALAGQPFEHLFADLIDREPELPAFLRPGGT